MSVSNGQPANETVFNDAFVSKTVDSSVVSNVELADPDTSQGTTVTQVQRELNSLNSFSGKTLNTAKDVKPTWPTNNVGTSTDSLLDRAIATDAELGAINGTLATAEQTANKGTANGYCPLNASTKIDATYLPSYVDDVEEYADLASFPVSGETSKIYIAIDTNLAYRWTGTVYIQISSSPVLSVNGETGTVVLTLDDIDDVTLTGAANRDFLRFNGTVWEDFNIDSSANDAAAGANQTLTAVATSVVRLTGALTSIDMIPAGFSGQKFILVNATGSTLTVNNATGATPANQILTGTGANANLADDANLWFLYDSTTSKWRVVGGSGGGGIAGPISSTDNAIVRWDGTSGGTVQNSGVTIDDSNNIVTPGTIRPQGGLTDGTNTITEGTVTSLRNVNSSVVDENTLRYDSTTSTWLNRRPENSDGALKGSARDFEIDIGAWVGYDDAAANPVDGTGGTFDSTLARTTTGGEVLNGIASLKLSKSAANRQGEGISLDFTVGEKFKGQPCKLKFSFKATANYDYGTAFDSSDPSDITVWFYDVTNSVLIQLSPYVTYQQGYFEGMFQMPTGCNTGRIILHIATTNALDWDFIIDDIDVELAPNQFVKADSDWESYTPTFTGFGTVTVQNFRFRKNGPNLEIQGRFTSGTPTATEARLSFPSGVLSASNLAAVEVVGKVATALVTASDYMALCEPSVAYLTFGTANSGNAGITKRLANGIIGLGDVVSITARIPIQGWTSGQVTAASANLNAPAVLSVYKNGGTAADGALIASWTGKNIDTLNGFNLTTGEYTVRSPGDYMSTFYLQRSTAATDPVSGIYVNGVVALSGHAGGGVSRTSVSGILANLKVGDIVSARLTANAGAIEASNTATVFTLAKVETSNRVYSTRVAYLKDVKAANTAGGTFTSGAYQTRTLNTLEGDSSFVSLASNQFTLQPGTYQLHATCPAYAVDAHKPKLRNITDSTDTILGTTQRNAAASSDHAAGFVTGVFSITAAKTFEIQHRCTTTQATNGFGFPANFGDSEVYTQVKIEKVL